LLYLALKKYSWHGDIKPDNILLVKGRYKLADFGFTKFAPVAHGKSSSVPTQYLDGFTDSYGKLSDKSY
jgi:serine/threonine protein kinase